MRAKKMASDSGSLAPLPLAAPPAPAIGPTEAAPRAAGRRPYQAPRILFREPLEAMAAICSPHPPAKQDKGHCPMGPISS
jgi:hypothetical protein